MYLSYLLFFITALLLALVLTPAVRSLGLRFGILDLPEKRKVHKEDIPRLGGIAVFAATVLTCGVYLVTGNFPVQEVQNSWQPLMGLTLGCLMVLGIGIWDDIYRLSPWPKLTVEICAALVAFSFGLKIKFIFNPFGAPLDIPGLNGFLTILWLVGITNAINLADGIDGLASGIATIAAAVLFFMTVPTVYTLVPYLAIALAGACLGFLRYNFSPATIFLGDSGSLFLGFSLGCLSLWASEKSVIAFALFIPITVLGLPIVDTIYAVLRRWHRGVPLGQADRDHIHHRLLEKGFSHRRAVLMLYGINLFLAALAGFLLFTRNSLAAYVVVLLGGAFVLGSRLLGYFRFAGLFQDLITRWKDSQKMKYLGFRTRLLARAFEEERTIQGRWELVGELFEELGIRQATVSLANTPDKLLTWTNAEPSQGSDKIAVFSLPLAGKEGPVGTLEILWSASQGVFPPGMSKVLNVMANEFCHGLDG
jgi:UDP-GlcNAc:undecaprenyl-phosphate/decaprenyl-phosphate GlcNAc-1-phosphate transferase